MKPQAGMHFAAEPSVQSGVNGASQVKRRICSYDMKEVSERAFVLQDIGGESYFCGDRCLALWSMLHLTHAQTNPEQVNAEWRLDSPEVGKRRFKNLRDLTKWAAANLLSYGEGEWGTLGHTEDIHADETS